MVVIGKRVKTNEKFKLWLTNPNRNFKETNVPQGQFSLTSQTRPPMKNLHQLTSDNSTSRNKGPKQENTFVDKSLKTNLDSLTETKTNLKDKTSPS